MQYSSCGDRLAQYHECRLTQVCRECEPWEGVTRTHYAQYAGTYHYAVFAREFVKAGRVGLTLVARPTLLVAAVEDFKVVAIGIIADKDIGEEFQE